MIKKVLMWGIVVILFFALPIYIGLPLLLIFIGWQLLLRSKKSPKEMKLSARSKAQKEVQDTNHEIIDNYQSNRNKIIKQNKKQFELSKDDVNYWTTNVDTLLSQIIDIEQTFSAEESLTSLQIDNQLFGVLEDIAARVINNPKDLLRFDSILQNLLPGFANSTSQYSKAYHDNLIANDSRITNMLEETRQQLKKLALAIQEKYRECLSKNSQSLSDAMSFSNALIHTESERSDNNDSSVTLEDLLKK